MYEIDGVPLSDPQWRWRLHRETQRRTPAAFRAVSTTVPGVDGDLPIYGEQVEATALALDLNVYGTPAEIEQRVSFLRGLLGKTYAPITIRRRDGLEAQAKPASISDPVMTPRYARMSVVLTIPAGVWRGPNVVWTHPDPAAGFATVDTLAGGSRPITDARILIRGPATTPEIADFATGAVVRFTGEVPAGQSLLIATDEWRGALGSGVGWTSTGTNATSRLVTSGPQSAAHMLTLAPITVAEFEGRPNTIPAVTFSASGTTADTRVQIRGRTAHL